MKKFDFSKKIEEAIEKKHKPSNDTICKLCGEVKSIVHQRKSKNIYRRAFSELKLHEMNIVFEKGYSYHFMSGGDIDFFSYVKLILKITKIDYLILSTWCMAMDDVLALEECVERKDISDMDVYAGEIFPGSYPAVYAKLLEMQKKTEGRLCIFRNHSKIAVVFCTGNYFVIESSANINTNPRTENTTIHVGDRGLASFYKDFFDEINDIYHKDEGWKKWREDAVSRQP